MSEKTCPNCGAALMPGDIFCGECGMRVQEADHDLASAPLPDDVSVNAAEEPLAKGPALVAEPTAGEYIPPPPAEERKSNWTAPRVLAIVVAVSFLLLSLCLCGLGGLMLIPSDSTATEEDLLFAMFCFAPGAILGLLGAGVAYFGLKRR